jgi:uncharacterized protein YndB with AHSA1/START domain
MKEDAMASVDARQEFSIMREFDAPRDLVWKAWTEPERLARWWGPKGSTIRIVKLDLRPGGLFHYMMQFQPGHDIGGRFVYREIVAPERLVYVSSFSDASGDIARAPFFDGKWPLEVLSTVTFTARGGQTELALRGAPIGASDEETQTFLGAIDSMRQGFGGTFDQLAAYLTQG